MADLTEPVTADDWALGPPDAPVTLVEYADFQCPYCRQMAPMLRRLQERYGDRLLLVYRHLPLSAGHPHAMNAAMAAEYAGAHGKFWEMHDLLFAHQEALDIDHLAEYARQLGLDGEEMKQAVETGRFRAAVRHDLVSGVRSGANGTPTIFINGDRYDGPRVEHNLADAIERAAGQPYGEEVETTGYTRSLPPES